MKKIFLTLLVALVMLLSQQSYAQLDRLPPTVNPHDVTLYWTTFGNDTTIKIMQFGVIQYSTINSYGEFDSAWVLDTANFSFSTNFNASTYHFGDTVYTRITQLNWNKSGNFSITVVAGHNGTKDHWTSSRCSIDVQGGFIIVNQDTTFYNPQASVSDRKEAVQQFYPNPASSVVNTPYGSYAIYSMMGQKVMETKSSTLINVNDLPNGSYFVINERGETNRFTVQH